MPNTGPVYQPTTVSYEQQGEWRNPSGLLSQTNTTIGRSRCLQWVILGLGVLALILGIVLVAAGSMAISNSETEVFTSDVIILIIGCILLLIGCVLVSVFVGHGSCRTGCPRILLKEKRIAHQMRDSQSVNGQAMNPSTDFLVTAQYAPVSEIAYQPPAVSEEEETRKLMGSDNKDCNEDNERILDKDPRIVLRPLSKVEEFQDAEVFGPPKRKEKPDNYPPSKSINTLVKESNITPTTEKFDSEDSPQLRRINYSTLKNERKFEIPKLQSPEELPIAKSNWKDTILRKASVRSNRAPLAGIEEITPSLRSSWSSMYFRTPSESESEGLSCNLDDVNEFL